MLVAAASVFVPILRVESAAMSSARISNTCCSEGGIRSALGFDHAYTSVEIWEEWKFEVSYLGHGLIVDVDKVSRRGVDLESLVEGHSRLE